MISEKGKSQRRETQGAPSLRTVRGFRGSQGKTSCRIYLAVRGKGREGSALCSGCEGQHSDCGPWPLMSTAGGDHLQKRPPPPPLYGGPLENAEELCLSHGCKQRCQAEQLRGSPTYTASHIFFLPPARLSLRTSITNEVWAGIRK